MIALLGASAIVLTALQASIEAPTATFRGCLHTAVDKAKGEKVGGDAIEAYLRNACTVQMGALKEALIGFRIKNGMTRKAASSDADMTVDDYVGTPVDNYKFMVNAEKPATPAPPAAKPAVATPAAATAAPATPPTQPPKP